MNKYDMIEDLKLKRTDANGRMQRILTRAKTDGRGLSSTETFQVANFAGEIGEFDERISELDAQVRADEAAAPMNARYAPKTGNAASTMTDIRSALPGRVKITRSEEIYRPDIKRSWFMDVGASVRGDSEARERLDRNARMADDRAKERGEARAISTTNGAGGELVPPMWLEDQYIKKARPRRVFADLVGPEALPAGTDVINIPKVTGGTAVAVQGSQNTAVQQTDLVTAGIASGVSTIAGGQTVSLQLIEQSPINVDDVIMGDLAADYAARLDTLLWNGDGTAGKPTGVLTLSGTNSVVWNGTALIGATSLYSALASGISKVATSRFEVPTAIVMHPRRYLWALSQQDSAGRPVILPIESGPMNAVGTYGMLNAEGPVGQILGLPVFLDANIPTNLGSGTDQDRILVGKIDDFRLWESHIRAEAFPQTYANQLSVFVRLYNYVSFQSGRFPESISVISGTGLNQVL